MDTGHRPFSAATSGGLSLEAGHGTRDTDASHESTICRRQTCSPLQCKRFAPQFLAITTMSCGRPASAQQGPAPSQQEGARTGAEGFVHLVVAHLYWSQRCKRLSGSDFNGSSEKHHAEYCGAS